MIQHLLELIQLQTGLQDNLKTYSEKAKLADLNIDEIKGLIEKAGGINNVEVRNRVFKEANEILDKMNYATYVDSEASKMSSTNPGQYYTVKGLVDKISFEDIKTSVERKID